MKLKLDENGHVVVQDGKPVYLHDDGKEIAFDAPAAMQKIASLNGEAKSHREAKEAAEAKLKGFEGIDDAAAAKKALETVKNLDDKKLIDAGEVEKVKAEIIKNYDEKLAEANQKADSLQSQLYQEVIGGAFSRSKTIADKTVLPAEVAQAYFGKHFSIEDGKVVAKDQHGNLIYSREKPGEPASFEEAMEALIGTYPNKDSILRSSQSSGGGSSNGSGGSFANVQKSLADCKTDAERIAYMQAKTNPQAS